MKFGQSIVRKITKIVAARCQILRLKCTDFDFGWGSVTDPVPATALPTSPSSNKGDLLLKEGKGCREGKEGHGAEGRGRKVLDGDPAPRPEKGGGASSPIFGPCLLWPNGWIDEHGTWHGGGPWPRPHCARWGPSSPPPKMGRAAPLIFGPFLLWPNCWMHQDATWYGGSPQPRRLCVRWGPSPLPTKGRSPPIFGPHLLWPNGCMDQGALGMEVGLGLRE